MNRSEFVARYRHQLHGLVADAAVRHTKGGELSIRLLTAFNEIESILASAYHVARGEADPNEKPAVAPPPKTSPPPAQPQPPRQPPPQQPPPGAKR